MKTTGGASLDRALEILFRPKTWVVRMIPADGNCAFLSNSLTLNACLNLRRCYELSWYRQFFSRIIRTKLGGDTDDFVPSASYLIFLTTAPAQELASDNGTL